jgi:hypothetical protein
MFIPNSPRPPSGMALNLAFRGGIVALLAGERLEISLGLALSRLKKEFVFEAFLS